MIEVKNIEYNGNLIKVFVETEDEMEATLVGEIDEDGICIDDFLGMDSQEVYYVINQFRLNEEQRLIAGLQEDRTC